MNQRPATQRRAAPKGFTLIEIGVVLLVAAMLVGVAIPTLRSVSGSQARSEVGKLASNIRAARGHAAVSGQTCRMAFDLDAQTYLVECAKGRVQVGKERSRNGEREEDEAVDEKRLSEQERFKLQVLKKAQFAASPDLPPQKFGGDLVFHSVWTSHQEEKYSKGKAFLYFYPSGLAERANIQLRFGEDFYTLQVSPLAGKVKVLADKAELPDVREED